MRKKINYIFAALLVGASVASFYACSSDMEEIDESVEVESPTDLHVREIKINATVNGYDTNAASARVSTRAGETAPWKEGDKVYLRFTSPQGVTTGEAVYNASKDNWTLSYYGSLYENAANTCTAVYIENPQKVEGTVTSLTEHSVIYEDNTGSYIVESGDLTVTANLTPKVGRMRFKGTAGKTMKVYGISHYTTYDASTHLYTNTNVAFEDAVNSDGYTNYFYGYFSNEDNPSVKLWIDKKEAYTHFFPSNVLTAGESGVMTLPTSEAHSSWTSGLTFCVKGKFMTMLPVEGGTFAMGSDSETDSNPVHNVTIDSYCIGETEITGDFYYTAINSTSTGTDIPLRTSKSEWVSFASKLSQITGANFVLPTEAQWEFAAKGGKKSQGFTYSGSNNIEEVAWYKVNSDDKFHAVKQKLPNELGLYDMTGNAREIVRDNWYAYTNSSQINPIFIDGSSYLITRGGRYDSNNTACTTTYRYKWNSSTSYYNTEDNRTGCRLILE